MGQCIAECCETVPSKVLHKIILIKAPNIAGKNVNKW